jgi:heterodisulfide reductase subunit B
MNTPHTPGPWRHGVSYPDGIDIIKDEAHPTHQPYWTVCKVNTCMGSESEANARLIAAAPDMRQLLQDIDNENGRHYHLDADLAQRLRALLDS